jgi:hypothetical protein
MSYCVNVGRPYWILHPVSCHTPKAATRVFSYSWGWTQKASETCRVILQWVINFLPSCNALVLYIYWLMMHGNSNIKNKKLFIFLKRWRSSRCKKCDTIILLFSVHYRCPTISATATLSNEEAEENATHMWPRKETRHLNLLFCRHRRPRNTLVLYLM